MYQNIWKSLKTQCISKLEPNKIETDISPSSKEPAVGISIIPGEPT